MAFDLQDDSAWPAERLVKHLAAVHTWARTHYAWIYERYGQDPVNDPRRDLPTGPDEVSLVAVRGLADGRPVDTNTNSLWDDQLFVFWRDSETNQTTFLHYKIGTEWSNARSRFAVLMPGAHLYQLAYHHNTTICNVCDWKCDCDAYKAPEPPEDEESPAVGTDCVNCGHAKHDKKTCTWACTCTLEVESNPCTAEACGHRHPVAVYKTIKDALRFEHEFYRYRALQPVGRGMSTMREPGDYEVSTGDQADAALNPAINLHFGGYDDRGPGNYSDGCQVVSGWSEFKELIGRLERDGSALGSGPHNDLVPQESTGTRPLTYTLVTADDVRPAAFPVAIAGDDAVVDVTRESVDAYFMHTEERPEGRFPIGVGLFWHGGVHLPVEAGAPVRACAPGTVVAARLAATPDGAHGSENFVLMRHLDLEGRPWYSLYMHLAAPPGDEAGKSALAWLRVKPTIDEAHIVQMDGLDGAMLTAVQTNQIVKVDRTVRAGDLLGHVAPFTRAGKEDPFLHWEVFSEENLMAGVEGWTSVKDPNASFTLDPVGPLFTSQDAAALRRVACQFAGEWSLDPARITSDATGLWDVRGLETDLAPYQLWPELSDEDERVPGALVYHYNPVAFLAALAGVAPVASDATPTDTAPPTGDDAAVQGGGVWHTIVRGEYLSLIALNYLGEPRWEDIYYHALNADFRLLRPDPDLVEPGDRVFVPTPGQAIA